MKKSKQVPDKALPQMRTALALGTISGSQANGVDANTVTATMS